MLIIEKLIESIKVAKIGMVAQHLFSFKIWETAKIK